MSGVAGSAAVGIAVGVGVGDGDGAAIGIVRSASFARTRPQLPLFAEDVPQVPEAPFRTT